MNIPANEIIGIFMAHGLTREDAVTMFEAVHDFLCKDERRQFVAMAMQGLLAGDTKGSWDIEQVSKIAIKQADDLIERLNK